MVCHPLYIYIFLNVNPGLYILIVSHVFWLCSVINHKKIIIIIKKYGTNVILCVCVLCSLDHGEHFRMTPGLHKCRSFCCFTHTHTHTHTHNTHTHTITLRHTDTHTHTHTHTHYNTQTHTHTHYNTQTQTHTHTHTYIYRVVIDYTRYN